MMFKLALWASLTFFKDEPQIKIAVANLICFLQVATHARLEPFSSAFKNTMQAFGICTAFAVSFGGLIINYLDESRKAAFLLRNEEEADSLQSKVGGVKLFLEILMYVSIVGYATLALWRTVEVARENRDRARRLSRRASRLLGRCCRRVGRGGDDQGAEEGAAADSNDDADAVAVSPRPASQRLDIDFESPRHNSINPVFERAPSTKELNSGVFHKK